MILKANSNGLVIHCSTVNKLRSPIRYSLFRVSGERDASVIVNYIYSNKDDESGHGVVLRQMLLSSVWWTLCYTNIRFDFYLIYYYYIFGFIDRRKEDFASVSYKYFRELEVVLLLMKLRRKHV